MNGRRSEVIKYILLLLLFSNTIMGFTLQEYKEANDRNEVISSNYSFDKLEINSFKEAYEFFKPFLKNNYAYAILTNPMELKGKFFSYRFSIIQVLGKRKFLLGADTGYHSYKYFIAEVDPSFKGNMDFVDDQIVNVIGGVSGIESYTSVTGSTATVVKLKIIAIE